MYTQYIHIYIYSCYRNARVCIYIYVAYMHMLHIEYQQQSLCFWCACRVSYLRFSRFLISAGTFLCLRRLKIVDVGSVVSKKKGDAPGICNGLQQFRGAKHVSTGGQGLLPDACQLLLITSTQPDVYLPRLGRSSAQSAQAWGWAQKLHIEIGCSQSWGLLGCSVSLKLLPTIRI